MTDYTKLKAQLSDVRTAYEKAGLHGENGAEIMTDALAAIEELEARGAKMEAFVRSCIGAKVYTAVDTFAKPHESEESRRARAIIAELETDNDRA